MQHIDLLDLLNEVVNKEIPVTAIAKATQIPTRKIEEALEQQKLNIDDEKYNSLAIFLIQLTHVSPLDPIYRKELVQSLIDVFEIEESAIARWIGIQLTDMETFKKFKISSPDFDEAQMRLQHFFMTFIRDYDI